MFFIEVTVSVPAQIAVGEGDGTVQVCAVLSSIKNNIANDISLLFTTSQATGM